MSFKTNKDNKHISEKSRQNSGNKLSRPKFFRFQKLDQLKLIMEPKKKKKKRINEINKKYN